MTERIEELVERRNMLARLSSGNLLLLPERAVALLDRAARLGVPLHREDLVLARTLLDDFDGHLADVERTLDDAVYADLLKHAFAARDWEPRDPRVAELAAAFVAHLRSKPELMAVSTSLHGRPAGASRYSLINDRQAAGSPTWARLSALVDAELRGESTDT